MAANTAQQSKERAEKVLEVLERMTQDPPQGLVKLDSKFAALAPMIDPAQEKEFIRRIAQLSKSNLISQRQIREVFTVRDILVVRAAQILHVWPKYKTDERELRGALALAFELAEAKELGTRKIVDATIDVFNNKLPQSPTGSAFFVDSKKEIVEEQIALRSQGRKPEIDPTIAQHLLDLKSFLDTSAGKKYHDDVKSEDADKIVLAFEKALSFKKTKEKAAAGPKPAAVTKTVPGVPPERLQALTTLRDDVVKKLQEISDEELKQIHELTNIEVKELKWLEKINIVHKVGLKIEKVHVSEIVKKIEKAGIKEEEIKNDPDLRLRYVKYLALTILHLHKQTESLKELIVTLKKVLNEEYADLDEMINPKKKTAEDSKIAAARALDYANKKAEAINKEYEDLTRMFAYTQKLRLYIKQLEEAEVLEESDAGYHLVLTDVSKKKSHLPKLLVVETLEDGSRTFKRAEIDDINLDHIDQKRIEFGKIDDPDVTIFLPNGHIASQTYGYMHACIAKETLVLDDLDSDGGTFVRRGDTVYWAVGPGLDIERRGDILDRVGVEHDDNALLFQPGVKLVDVSRIQLQPGDLVEFGNTAHYIFRVEARGKVRKLKKIQLELATKKEPAVVTTDDGYHLVLDTSAKVQSPRFTITTLRPDGSKGFENVAKGDVHLERISATSNEISFGLHPALCSVTLADPQLSAKHAIINRDTLTLADNDSETGTFVRRQNIVYWVTKPKVDNERSKRIFNEKGFRSLLAYQGMKKLIDVQEVQLQEGDYVEFGNKGNYIFKVEAKGKVRKIKKENPKIIKKTIA
ncbi:FHA domain-containing protein [Candidatus Woesearchaeota archaeon]|nr:FHA domain-containing protein [Candidatus Woesearchaeota archaeon]